MLKEEDPMIELIRDWIIRPHDLSAGLQLSVLEVFQVIQDMIAEHVMDADDSRLRKLLPSINRIFLPLDLVRAVKEYDTRKHLLARKRVPPTFKEVRHILNLATVHAIASKLKLVTFDADDTIYEDGGTISATSGMVKVIVELLRRGVVVSLVTAAGYPGNPGRYEERLRGILDALESCTKEERARFLVMGGECNYLLETYTKASCGGKVFLRDIDGHLWKDGRGVRWLEDDITELLDSAEKTLRETTQVLHMEAMILRKERAIGIVNTTSKRYTYEDLEEICLTLQHELKHCNVPFCAFNGGNDVWVDVGNKALGIQALQKYVFRFLPKHLQDQELVRCD
jgi:IMP and pyridine-specific 5'-nucleotidase